ncbi:hypothetical protein [Solidesulfovibrio fructosivorans]|uniref:hypothetical protein n=1 Tax=Solidesulfovibrio fructosivorans TaxID=878 RepID=UPI00117BF836|nr:hypothetical protein [Solidesulfovibrio fructosivorans]
MLYQNLFDVFAIDSTNNFYLGKDDGVIFDSGHKNGWNLVSASASFFAVFTDASSEKASLPGSTRPIGMLWKVTISMPWHGLTMAVFYSTTA